MCLFCTTDSAFRFFELAHNTMKDLSGAIAHVEILAAAYRPSGSDKKDMNKLIENAPCDAETSICAPRKAFGIL